MKIEKKAKDMRLSDKEKAALLTNELLQSDGLEFEVTSNMKAEPLIFNNGFVLVPCFSEDVDGKSLNDPDVVKHFEMLETGIAKYDGWMPISTFDKNGIRQAIRVIDDTLNSLSLLLSSNATFEWSPKYFMYDYPHFISVPKNQTTQLTNNVNTTTFLIRKHPKLSLQFQYLHQARQSLRKNNFAQAIRDLFLIIENTEINEEAKYKSLRNAVSHEKINSKNDIDNLSYNFGIKMERGTNLDVNNPEIQKILEKEANNLLDIIIKYLLSLINKP